MAKAVKAKTKAKAVKTVRIGTKDVPLTNGGLPNKVYLNKAQRELITKEQKKRKEKETALELKELSDLLSKL